MNNITRDIQRENVMESDAEYNCVLWCQLLGLDINDLSYDFSKTLVKKRVVPFIEH